MSLSLKVAVWLTEWAKSDLGHATLAALPRGSDPLKAVLGLRKLGLRSEQSAAVAELHELRSRAAAKFEQADQLFFTRRAYEQASGQNTARWKVHGLRRLATEKPPVLLDLCCGIGGDLLEFSRHFPTLALDRDPALVHLTRENLHTISAGESVPLSPCLVMEADVCSLVPSFGTPPDLSRLVLGPQKRLADWLPFLPSEASQWADTHGLGDRLVVWHLDPDRRDERGRHTSLADLSPNEDFLRALLAWSGTGMIKLAPATELSEEWQGIGHWQWLGSDRECKQLLGWFGFDGIWKSGYRSVAVARRNAPGWDHWQPAEHSSAARAKRTEPRRYLHEPHPAFYAARLAETYAAEHGCELLVGGDYFTADQVIAETMELCSAFEVLEVLPLRVEKIRDWLARENRELKEIKSRTVAEKDWKPLTLLVGTLGRQALGKGVSALLFQQAKPGGKALRVALCERLAGRSP